MNRIFSIALVSALGLGPLCAYSADMASEERSELRQRAEAFQAARARNPNFQPGEGRLNRPVQTTPKAQAKQKHRGSHARTKATRSKSAKSGKLGRAHPRQTKRAR